MPAHARSHERRAAVVVKRVWISATFEQQACLRKISLVAPFRAMVSDAMQSAWFGASVKACLHLCHSAVDNIMLEVNHFISVRTTLHQQRLKSKGVPMLHFERARVELPH